ncbi:MAG: hypothetical protein OJF62_000537 [Pseudolabrys sp.]|nr:hypothetical protein [Pseudolabrys sp.]
MAALTVASIFLRFWTRSGDLLFLLFGIAFGIDAVMRFVLSFSAYPAENEPFYYLPRLVSYGLIVIAILYKNKRQTERASKNNDMNSATK